MRKTVLIVCLLLIALAVAGQSRPAAADANGGGVVALSEGGGRVLLFWFPPLGKWPAGGFRVSEEGGKVLAARVVPGEAGAMASLTPEDRKLIAGLLELVTQPRAAKETQRLYATVAYKAAVDPGFARAAGLRWDVVGVGPGSHRYRLSGLDRQGLPSGVEMVSAPVDAGKASPRPAAPRALAAKATDHGVELYWGAADREHDPWGVGFAIERSTAGGSAEPLTVKPLLLSREGAGKLPAFLDAKAPEEAALTYRVAAVDLFGRRSAPAGVDLFYPSPDSLRPPQGVTAKTGGGGIELSWTANPSRFTTATVIERAVNPGGPWETLTPQGVAAGHDSFRDPDVTAGTRYFYRLRAVGSQGDLGPASPPVAAQGGAAGRPGQVRGLKALQGPASIRLSWDAAVGTFSGYLVERRSGGEWQRLNASILQQPSFDDPLARGYAGTFQYRVSVVGYDNQVGEPSAVLEIRLAGGTIPTPTVRAVEGTGGEARVFILPGETAAGWQTVVLRSGWGEGQGVVVSPPLPADASEFVDGQVRPGENYWYRVRSIQASGLQGPLSAPVPVRIANPLIPGAGRPKALFEAAPFPRVTLTFAPPPAGFSVVVQRRAAGDKFWTTLPGGATTGRAVDATPPKSGAIAYRIVLQAANGAWGEASPSVEVRR